MFRKLIGASCGHDYLLDKELPQKVRQFFLFEIIKVHDVLNMFCDQVCAVLDRLPLWKILR